MYGINSEAIYNFPGKVFQDILSGNLKFNYKLIIEISKQSSLSTDSLIKLLEKLKDYIRENGNKLSLSASLNKRNQKSGTALNDFILKNNKAASGNPLLSQAIASILNFDPATYETMQTIYNAFLDSDKKGFEALDSLKTPPNLGCSLFYDAVVTALLRKLSKLALDFSVSAESGISNSNFIISKSFKDLLVDISNQSKWRGNNQLSGIGNVSEPNTFSELRHIRRNNLAVSFLDNQAK